MIAAYVFPVAAGLVISTIVLASVKDRLFSTFTCCTGFVFPFSTSSILVSTRNVFRHNWYMQFHFHILYSYGQIFHGMYFVRAQTFVI